MANNERLIVDDNEDARNLAIKITRAGMPGIIPIAVGSVEEALKKLEPPDETFYDIVTDANLLDGNCVPVVEAARNKVPPIHVIVWSNDSRLGGSLVAAALETGQSLEFVDKRWDEISQLIR